MNSIKKNPYVLIGIFIVLVGVFFAISHTEKNYSVADFGVPPLLKADCSSLKNTNTNSAVTISFNVSKVSTARDQIKMLITKYSGQVTGDSFNSYSSQDPNTPSQDSASITVTFGKSQGAFLTELSDLVRNTGGVDANYNYSDGGQPQYGSYSSYISCINMMQSVSADVLQLEVLIKALRDERDPNNISLLSQSIATAKSTLQADASSMNGFFATYDKPTVSISIGTLQK